MQLTLFSRDLLFKILPSSYISCFSGWNFLLTNHIIIWRVGFSAMAPHSSTLLPGKSHGWRSLVGCSPWGRWESDTTEQLHFPFSLPCIGEGNGNPLQCSCLENPRDGGAWSAAVYGVTQSWTRLKRLSSSSSSDQNGQIQRQKLHQRLLGGFWAWRGKWMRLNWKWHRGFLRGWKKFRVIAAQF